MAKKERAPGVKTGRPREYHSDTLLPILKPIWFASNQPCGCRLRAMSPEWIPAYEAELPTRPRRAQDAPERLREVAGPTACIAPRELRTTRRDAPWDDAAAEHPDSRNVGRGRPRLGGNEVSRSLSRLLQNPDRASGFFEKS